MMKQIDKFCCCIFSLFLMVACQEEEIMDKTAGFQVSLQDMGVAIETKSTPAELGKPLADQFKLKVVKNGDSSPLFDGNYTSQTIPASAGTYTISASYGDNPVLALDAPYYLGDTTNVVIKEGEQKKITLSCKVANALASASFPTDTELKKIFSSYWVKVVVGKSSCKLTSDSKKSAYFQAEKQVAFYFEGTKVSGKDFSEELKHKDLPSVLKAGHHVKLTLKLSDDLLLDVAKVEIKKETITSDIPMDWLPKPKVEAEGFENNILSFAETETKTAILNLNTASALQDLKLKFTFGDPQFSSLNDKDYLLSVPADKAEMENVLGIVLPEIGVDKASLDLTSIVAKLRTDAGTTVENKIEVDVRANNRWSSEEIKGQENPSRVYTLRCNKPEMAVSVQPGNIWTKEFTIDELTVTTGDPEVIKSKLKYQYKEKSGGDDTWKDIQDMKVLFNEHPQNRSYQVRAVYRDVVMTDAIDVELENPVQLPNSGMEEWHEEDQSDHKNLWFPFSQDLSLQWITNNLETTNYRGESFCSASAVKRSENKYNGNYAALIRTIGHGVANTNVGSFLGMNGSITGTHTIGILSYSGDFQVRPTKVKFYYRYIPEGDDVGVIELKIENEDQDQDVILYEATNVVSKTEYQLYEIPIN
ncbi:DUF4493 domain-containing protein [Parabacteroides distasonis]|uniref:DUF4493 domain-containing protein n=2 Tax=Tannerellaceae TaxID=2005525 RepID=UPI001EDE0DAE|nr:DUF4493 domain-containing protein [Parabacteroides distasonis]MCG4888147.1 DUF4493 domain-containing protein [Parabacteroides distasonis]